MFDGRLVINKHYQTNDPCIYAAGPMTKFKRILYADQWRHEFVCSREVGIRLAHMTLTDLSPVRVRPHETVFMSNNMHVYRHCKVIQRAVLGGYYYLNVRQPGRALPYELAHNLEDYVRAIGDIRQRASTVLKVIHCRAWT